MEEVLGEVIEVEGERLTSVEVVAVGQGEPGDTLDWPREPLGLELIALTLALIVEAQALVKAAPEVLGRLEEALHHRGLRVLAVGAPARHLP